MKHVGKVAKLIKTKPVNFSFERQLYVVVIAQCKICKNLITFRRHIFEISYDKHDLYYCRPLVLMRNCTIARLKWKIKDQILYCSRATDGINFKTSLKLAGVEKKTFLRNVINKNYFLPQSNLVTISYFK